MRRFFLAGILAGMLAGSLGATEVRTFSVQSQAELLKGTIEGVNLDTLGRLRLAERVRQVGFVAEGLALAVAAHPEGWVVGGKSGKVLLIERRGRSRVLYTAPEPEIFALWADADGTVFAGSSPKGKVYRITPAGGTAFFDPGETYIWALARDSAGDLLVATGTEAKLFGVDSQGTGRLLYRSEEPHLRSLLIDPEGSILVGTAGEGLIVELPPSGRPRPRFSESGSEVVSLAWGPDGSCYAAVLPSNGKPGEASGVAIGQGGPSVGATNALAGQAPTTSATYVPPSPSAPTASAGGSGATSQSQSKVVRIRPSGAIETVWQFPDESVYCLLWARDRLWIGTGPAGRLYSYGAAGLVVEQAVAQQQVTGLTPDEPGPALLTNNSAGLYRLAAEQERRGSFTSAPVDVGEVSRFGTFRWRGQAPAGSVVEFAFRTGLTETLAETWSAWTPVRSGREIDLGELVPGRYFQWLAILRSASQATPRLDRVEFSYQQRNGRPRIKSFNALDPGQILVPPTFNPADQVYEPAHPNRDGIFTSLGKGPTNSDPQLAMLKQLWKKGYRSFRWSAEDPNGDSLVYALFFTSDELGGTWLPVARELRVNYYSFDSTVLPDGIYRFRLVASDSPANDADEALEAEQVTGNVVIDHSLPQLAAVEPRGAELRVSVRDAWSPLREVRFSVDASEWVAAIPIEGLVDATTEQFVLNVPEGSKLLLLRITDAAWNTTTFDLSSRVRGADP